LFAGKGRHAVEAILGSRRPAPEGGSKKNKGEDNGMKGVSQDEQGAVAALLAAAGVEEEKKAGGATSTEWPEVEYCLKWAGRAHCHAEWLPVSVVEKLAPRKLAKFRRKHGIILCNLTRPEWEVCP
jgi:hypothetical protein